MDGGGLSILHPVDLTEGDQTGEGGLSGEMMTMDDDDHSYSPITPPPNLSPHLPATPPNFRPRRLCRGAPSPVPPAPHLEREIDYDALMDRGDLEEETLERDLEEADEDDEEEDEVPPPLPTISPRISTPSVREKRSTKKPNTYSPSSF